MPNTPQHDLIVLQPASWTSIQVFVPPLTVSIILAMWLAKLATPLYAHTSQGEGDSVILSCQVQGCYTPYL